jgi:hypothetical protein
MDLQIEAVRKQILKHYVEIVDAISMIRSTSYIELLAAQPIRTSDNLPTRDAVHDAEHVFNRDSFRVVTDAIGKRIDLSRRSTRF